MNSSKHATSANDLLAKIERILCLYYSVKSIDELGVGNFKHLIDQLEKDTSSTKNSGIIYENSVIEHDCTNTQTPDDGITKAELVKRLGECPLLENVYDYLDWSEYTAKFGDLKQFVEHLNDANTNQNLNIDLIEVEPFSNRLYKLSRNTEIEQLKQAIVLGDYVNAAGHLVSLISIKYRSLGQTPRSLLINEIESALSVYWSKSKNEMQSFADLFQKRHEYFSYYCEVTKQPCVEFNDFFFSFVVNFICRVPFKILEQILFSYIIEPLVKLDGNHRIKQNLFEYLTIRAYLDNPHFLSNEKINFFVKIGQHCAIDEWSLSNCESIVKILATKSKSMLRHVTPVIQHETQYKIEKEEESTPQENQTESGVENLITIEETPVNDKPDSGEELSCQKDEKSMLTLTDQYEHVKSIREKYGIGIELNEQTKNVTESLKGN